MWKKSTHEVILGVVVFCVLLLLWSMNQDLKEMKSEIRWNSTMIELLNKDK